MNKYEKHNERESGVALIFAIGLLALMLGVGLAFLGNAMIFKNVAVNNSARTQSRMLALSAANRAAAAVMMYQHQFALVNNDEFPDSFDHIRSYAKYDSDGKAGGSIEFDDGLLNKEDSRSVMLLPEDGSVVDRSLATSYNLPFKEKNWSGKWVFFYNTYNESDEKREIIGRAAWQVVTSSAQILAPVFFRGYNVNGVDAEDETFAPREHRWGRDVDEVFLDDSTPLFKDLYAVFPPTDAKTVTSYDQIYTLLNISEANDQEWIKKWLIPDVEENATIEEPTPISPEVYACQPQDSKNKRQFVRFNISELVKQDGKAWHSNYNVSASSDPWYARLGINSVSSGDVNSSKAIRKLTVDNITYASDAEKYDFEVPASYRPGLPYLRRIGNSDDGATYLLDENSPQAAANVDMAAWRRQIAANFNDYCDADSTPTSDVAAAKWNDEISAAYTHPKFTGNEKTPYLYELGGKIVLDVNDTDWTPGGGILKVESGKMQPAFPNALRFAPMVKLVNMYDSTSCTGLTAHIDPGEVNLWYKLQQITLKGVVFEYQNDNDETVEFKVDVTLRLNAPPSGSGSDTLSNIPVLNNLLVNVRSNADGWKNLTDTKSGVTFADGLFNNANGTGNGYPFGAKGEWMHSRDGSEVTLYSTSGSGAITLNKINETDLALTFNRDLLTNAGTGNVKESGTTTNATIPGQTLTFKSVEKMHIDSIQVMGMSIQPRRAVLMGSDNGKVVGLDYVRPFPKPLPWDNKSVLELKYTDDANSAKGLLWGGVCNYDPRQNLNPLDWYGYEQDLVNDWYPRKNTETYNKLKVVAVEDFESPQDSQLRSVMLLSDDDIAKGKINSTTDAQFSPQRAVGSASADPEVATEPAFTGSSRISTAHIRNAPMMSPWEIGAIHRGVRWQTINIKTASSASGGDFTPEMLEPHGDDGDGSESDESWKNSGAKYQDGDAGILEQIKMTERRECYGKINVNMLCSAHKEFDAAGRDKNIAIALFNKLKYNEPMAEFITKSTRSGGKFTGTQGGDTVSFGETHFNNMKGMSGSQYPYNNRVEYLSKSNGGNLANAFGAATPDANDAAQEEIIGKTINLLTAETVSPAIVRVVVVAQSIIDRAGTQVKITGETAESKFSDPNGGSVEDIEDSTISKECQLGRFDMLEHSESDEKNVYFDEITGEVKILVTFERSPTTGKLRITRVDYL